MVIHFGKYKGREIQDIQDDKYLIGLAKDFYRDIGGKLPDDIFKFKVPDEVRIEARRVLIERGYKFKGSRVEKDE